MEILTIDEVAAFLRISKRHVYEMMQDRTRSGDLREHPLPFMKLGRSVRFRKSDVEAWIEKLVAGGK
jgi:predicted DNA-binding transcriptional regulator AlpA